MDFKFESLMDEEGAQILSDFYSAVPEGLRGSVESLSEGEFGFPALVGEALGVFSDGTLASFFLFTLGVVVFMAIAANLSGALSSVAQYAVTVICAVALLGSVMGVVRESQGALSGVIEFFTAFLPIVSAAVAYGGGVGAAAIGAAGANMTLGIIGAFFIPLMNSLSALLCALGFVGALDADGGGNLVGRIKSFFTWLVGLCSALLLSALALQSAIGSSADTAAMRAAKYAAGGTVPIVGSTVSSAMGALVSGAEYIKSVIGVGALAVLLLTALSPLLMLLLYRSILSFGEGLLEFVGAARGARMLGGFRAAFDVLSAVFAISVTVLLLEVVILMKSGVNAV